MKQKFIASTVQVSVSSTARVGAKRRFTAEADIETLAVVDFVNTPGSFTGHAELEVQSDVQMKVRKPFTADAHIAIEETDIELSKRRNYATPPKTQGINPYAVFFPPFKFIWQDEEPGSFYTSADEIQGLVTGVPKLGSMLQVAFVNEPVDIRWFGARDRVTDWGDGQHENPGSYVHTYTDTGFYWFGATSATNTFQDEEGNPTNISNLKAARLIHVIERDPRGNGGGLDDSGNIWTHTKPYNISIQDPTEGSVDGAFAMKFSLVSKGNYPNDDEVGEMPAGTGLVVFIESYEDGAQLPELRIVGGGFIAQRTAAEDPYNEIVAAIAYDPLYWMNLQQMREQYYVNQGLITSQILGEMAYDILDQTIDECGKRTTKRTPVPGAPSYVINIPALDLALLGYIPEHILATLRPDMAAAHMIQHVRITVPDFEIPNMYNLPRPTHFSNLGQLANITVSPTFSEKVALGGYHSFSVSAGSVLSNIRAMLENQGAMFHSRSDLTFVMDYKPYHKPILPAAKLSLVPPPTITPGLTAEGVPQPLWRVQIQKPLLGFTFDNISLPNDGSNPLNPATGEPASSSDLGLIVKSQAYLRGLLGVSAEVWSDWYKQVAMPLYQQLNSPQTIDLSNWDFYNDSLDQRNFIWEVEVGDPGGRIIGPIQNVFTDNLQNFAVGIAKEAMAHWQMIIPLAGVPDVDLGDIILVTKESKGLHINWVRKSFWVTGLRVLMQGSVHIRELTVLEVDPPEVVVHTPDPD
jgi:hypothetical protein